MSGTDKLGGGTPPPKHAPAPGKPATGPLPSTHALPPVPGKPHAKPEKDQARLGPNTSGIKAAHAMVAAPDPLGLSADLIAEGVEVGSETAAKGLETKPGLAHAGEHAAHHGVEHAMAKSAETAQHHRLAKASLARGEAARDAARARLVGLEKGVMAREHDLATATAELHAAQKGGAGPGLDAAHQRFDAARAGVAAAHEEANVATQAVHEAEGALGGLRKALVQAAASESQELGHLKAAMDRAGKLAAEAGGAGMKALHVGGNALGGVAGVATLASTPKKLQAAKGAQAKLGVVSEAVGGTAGVAGMVGTGFELGAAGSTLGMAGSTIARGAGPVGAFFVGAGGALQGSAELNAHMKDPKAQDKVWRDHLKVAGGALMMGGAYATVSGVGAAPGVVAMAAGAILMGGAEVLEMLEHQAGGHGEPGAHPAVAAKGRDQHHGG